MTIPRRLAVVCMHAACIWIASGTLAAAAAQDQEPVATVGGAPIFEKDILTGIVDQIQKLQKQEYDLKLKALEDEINRRLIQAEADKRGLTVNQYFADEVDTKVRAPSDREIEQELVTRMFRGSGSTDKEEIADELWQNAILAAREDLFLELQARAGVKIHLQPPRVAVTFDPDRLRGAPDAPITLIEFADFHCPYCGQMYQQIKTLLARYQGRVKLGYRDLPLLEVPEEVVDSPEAARCAGEQGKFWEYHDLLFEHQDQVGEQAFKGFANTLRLDQKAFSACLESRKFKEPIDADFQEALRIGATGTPYFFINGIPLGGAHPLADFEEIIDAELKARADNSVK